MKIIHLVSNKTWGGGEQYVLDLATAQRAGGHDVAVMTRNFPAVSRRFLDAGFPVTTMPLKGSIDIISPLILGRCLAKEGKVVVHVHNFKDAVVATRARSLSGNNDVRVVLTRHLVRPARTSRRHIALYRSIDAMVFVSQLALDEFLSSCPQVDMSRVHVIHNGISVPSDVTDTTPSHSNSDITVMYHGRIAPEKGIDILINALPLVKHPGLRVVIAGTGRPEYIATLRRLADVAGVSGMIDWAGHVDDIFPLIRQTDIGVTPSRARESFGLATVEYMACGKPVIATTSGAQREYINDGVNGLLVPPDDPQALAEAITRLCDSPTLRHRLGTAAKATVIDRLSYSRFYNAIMAIYNSLTDS
ncbi:MAG: glycosyltransferase family 4 protein [Pseudoflavonifractor sp.]|nr:glycosyltransferase family 4 protein [Pseudoflavonifractor sp.]